MSEVQDALLPEEPFKVAWVLHYWFHHGDYAREYSSEAEALADLTDVDLDMSQCCVRFPDGTQYAEKMVDHHYKVVPIEPHEIPEPDKW